MIKSRPAKPEPKAPEPKQDDIEDVLHKTTKDVPLVDVNYIDFDEDVYIGADGYPYYHEDWVIQGSQSSLDDGSEDTRV